MGNKCIRGDGGDFESVYDYERRQSYSITTNDIYGHRPSIDFTLNDDDDDENDYINNFSKFDPPVFERNFVELGKIQEKKEESGGNEKEDVEKEDDEYSNHDCDDFMDDEDDDEDDEDDDDESDCSSGSADSDDGSDDDSASDVSSD